FRVLLLPGGKVRLCSDFDLMCMDAASMGVVMHDWGVLSADLDRQLPELMPRAFEAIVRAGVEVRETERYARDVADWNERRPSFDPTPQLPQARGASALEQHRNIRHQAGLDAEVWQQLCAHARAHGITPTMTVCTAFAQVIGRWSAGAPFILNMTNFTRPE